MLEPTPTVNSTLPTRASGFARLTDALDYAARGETGLNFHNARGELVERLPYSQLREDAIGLARKLLAAGFEPGERVAMVAETHGDFMRAFFACQYGGLVATPLPLPATFGGRQAYVEQISRQMQFSGASAVFGPAELKDFVDEAAAQVPSLRLNAVLAQMDDPVPDGVALPEVDPEQLSYLQYSSGSTRFPVAAAVTHAAAMSNTTAITRHGLMIGRGDRCTSWLPLYHDMGLIGFMMTPVACQMSVDYIATREFARRPLLWLQLISRNRGTLSFSPSFGYDLCSRRARTAKVEGVDLSSWRCAGIGADMIRPNVLAEFVERFAPYGFRPGTFVPSYGLAESTLAVSFAPLGRGFEVDRVDLDRVAEEVAAPAGPETKRIREFVLCGVPMPDHTVEIRKSDGRVCGQREIGRVFTRGPSLMREYFAKPEETAAVLDRDGWLDTGDLGYWIGDQLVITGRMKDLIIVNGRNIWPQDLEWSVEREVEGLRSGDVAAISVDQGERERVVLLVECRLRKPAERADLTQRVAGVVQSLHGTECDVVLVPPHGLPQTSSGKLSRSRARQNYLRGEYDEVALPAASGG